MAWSFYKEIEEMWEFIGRHKHKKPSVKRKSMSESDKGNLTPDALAYQRAYYQSKKEAINIRRREYRQRQREEFEKFKQTGEYHGSKKETGN